MDKTIIIQTCMSNRTTMRNSHRKIVNWLLSNGFDDIQVISHGKSVNVIYSTYSKNEKSYLVKWDKKQKTWITYGIDIWNIGDMLAIRKSDYKPFLVQVKTNGNLDKVIEIAKYGMYQKYKGLRNWIGFMACKPIKNSKRVEYRIL